MSSVQPQTDPIIGQNINDLVKAGAKVSDFNPIGMNIKDIQAQGHAVSDVTAAPPAAQAPDARTPKEVFWDTLRHPLDAATQMAHAIVNPVDPAGAGKPAVSALTGMPATIMGKPVTAPAVNDPTFKNPASGIVAAAAPGGAATEAMSMMEAAKNSPAAEAAKSAGSLIREKFAPSAPAVNKWMGVAERQISHGADPAGELIDNNLLGKDKASTLSNVQAERQKIGTQFQSYLEGAGAQGSAIDGSKLVSDPLANAKSLYKSPTEDAFTNHLASIEEKIKGDFPDLDQLSPARAQELKESIDRNINWHKAGEDPINDAFIEMRSNVNNALKANDPGVAPLLQRYSNLRTAEDALQKSMRQDQVGNGTGAHAPGSLGAAFEAAKPALKKAALTSAGLGAGAAVVRRFWP